MKLKLHTSSLLLFTFSLLAAPAVRAADYVYFSVNAFSWDGPKLFDYAMVGVAKDGELEWGGAGGDEQVYLTICSTPGSSAESADYAASDEARYTALGWADLTEYVDDGSGSEYLFYIETYLNGKTKPVNQYYEDDAQSYAELKKNGHIFDSSQTDPQKVTPWTVPEPASGLLVLLGAGLAAWRRRRRGGLTSRGSRLASRASRPRGFLFLSVVSLLISHFSLLTCHAGADDTLVSFSTKGPDTYLDSTTVKDGECYALVWTRAGATFEGLAADGSAVGTNSRVVVFAPVAKGGRCPPVLFELDAELAKSYAGGAFNVYLLDTRLASGAVGGVKANGFPVAVNGWGSVDANFCSRQNEDETSSEGRDQKIASTGARIAVSSRSALPANTPKPTITAIRLVGDNVYLTVKGTLPCLKYKAVDANLSCTVDATSSSDSVDANFCSRQNEDGSSSEGRDQKIASTAAQGAASVDDEITIIAPKKGSSGLYSVSRD